MSAGHAMAGPEYNALLLRNPVDTYIEEATYADSDKEEENPGDPCDHCYCREGLIPRTCNLTIIFNSNCECILSTVCITLIGNLYVFPVSICFSK